MRGQQRTYGANRFHPPSIWMSVPILALAAWLGSDVLWAHGKARLRVSSPSVAQGGSVRVSGSGAADPGKEVVIAFEKGETRLRLGATVAGKDGEFVAAVSIPPDAPVGSATMSATGHDGRVTATITVLRGAAAPPTPQGMQMDHAAMGHGGGERAPASSVAAGGPVEGRAEDMPLELPRAPGLLAVYLAFVFAGGAALVWLARV